MEKSIWAPKPADSEERANEFRSTATLSASAPSYSPSPAPPPPDISTDDHFAQTGAPQDALFDDVLPVHESMRVRSDDELFNDGFTPVAQAVVEQPSPPPQPRSGAEGRRAWGRGRGIDRGGVPRINIDGSSRATPTTDGQSEGPEPSSTRENAPTGPQNASVLSLRGDRQATGGARQPKLTEEELAARMERVRIRTAELNAAHERQEADAAAFAQREAQAKKQTLGERQKVERRDRQQMMGERERNRMRKLNAMEGREWDMEKNQDDFARGARHDKRGGFAGDREDYTDGREYLYREPRGGGRRQGVGRGGEVQEQKAPRSEEFPALPLAPKVLSDEDATAGAQSMSTTAPASTGTAV